MTSRSRLLAVFAGALIIFFDSPCLARTADSEIPELFTPAADGAFVPSSVYAQWVVEVSPVSVRVDVLSNLSVGDRVTLNLLPDVRPVLLLEKRDIRSATSYSWYGRLEEDYLIPEVIIGVEGDAVGLTLAIPEISSQFDLVHLDENVHALRRLDPTRLPECGGSLRPPDTGRTSPGSRLSAGPLDPAFDILILYTTSVRDNASPSRLNSIIRSCVDYTNAAYSNSGLAMLRARVVYSGEVDYNESGGTFYDHLNRLTRVGDGVLEEAHALRNQYGADQVTLLVNDTDGGTVGGLGWCSGPDTFPEQQNAFTVMYHNNGSRTFAHELGHNQGCAHDREHDSGDCGLFPSSYGWRFVGQSGTQFRTVMAYLPGSEIAHFSNPSRTYDGVQTGVPIGQPNESNNANTIFASASTIEGFRLTRFDIWVDRDYPDGGDGSFEAPYNRIDAGVFFAGDAQSSSELPSLWIKTGVYSESLSITKSMVLRAFNGPVQIGN